MPMAIPTHRSKPDACKICGKTVTHFELENVVTSTPIWDPEEHSGPCGRPCLGGGVEFKDIAGGVHGWPEHPCPCPKDG